MEIENKIWLDDETLGYIEEKHYFDKDKYIDDIFGYQEMLYEIIEDKRDINNCMSISEEESVYQDILDYTEDKFDNWNEEKFIQYIKYLKKLVGDDK